MLLTTLAFAAEIDRIPAPSEMNKDFLSRIPSGRHYPSPPCGTAEKREAPVDTCTPRATDYSWSTYLRGPEPHSVGGYLAERPGFVILGESIVSLGGTSEATWYVDGVRLARSPSRLR